MNIKVIKNDEQYREYLSIVEKLIEVDPLPDTKAAEELELYSLLIENYEKENFQFEVPDPIDAILFRMEEKNLKQKDLVPIIGSKSKVSEIISGKRKLTLNMIRSLNENLDIPLNVLISENKNVIEDDEIDWKKYPFKIMEKRGWFEINKNIKSDDFASNIKEFLFQAGCPNLSYSYFRRTIHIGGEVSNNIYSINAWLARVVIKARDYKVEKYKFDSNDIAPRDFMAEIAKLSWFDEGPKLAREMLAKKGIVLVIEPHLPKTHLDGCATLDLDGTPLIGLTLRYDRLDNFWFTLMHEIAHIFYHLGVNEEAFVDNTNFYPDGEKREVEANKYAQEAFIPRTIWSRSDAYRHRTTDAILELSNKLQINPAVIAGRIRKETGNYKLLNDLVGHGGVRCLFSNEWKV